MLICARCKKKMLPKFDENNPEVPYYDGVQFFNAWNGKLEKICNECIFDESFTELQVIFLRSVPFYDKLKYCVIYEPREKENKVKEIKIEEPQMKLLYGLTKEQMIEVGKEYAGFGMKLDIVESFKENVDCMTDEQIDFYLKHFDLQHVFEKCMERYYHSDSNES